MASEINNQGQETAASSSLFLFYLYPMQMSLYLAVTEMKTPNTTLITCSIRTQISLVRQEYLGGVIPPFAMIHTSCHQF